MNQPISERVRWTTVDLKGDELSSPIPILPNFTCAMSTTGYAYAQLFT
ncbi:MAG: hypothetical protein V7K64_26535 [Nostoc sp.]